MSDPLVVLEGFEEFRRDLRLSGQRLPQEVTRALEVAATPALERARSAAPRRRGTLAGSLGVRVRGTTASLVGQAPYAAGAEWGRAGKWRGFTQAWGEPPRYAWPAVAAAQEEVADLLYRELEAVLTLRGWLQVV
jgi:hypothetical protein